jgi:hypothetical protein
MMRGCEHQQDWENFGCYDAEGNELQPYAPKRDWRVRCYDTTGEMRVCVIDSDHGALRIALTIGEQEQLFELRAKQVDQFQAALEATLVMIKSGGPDQSVRWEGHCYTRWDEPMCCLIEATQHDAVRISCVLSTYLKEFSLELREDQIGEFQVALAAGVEVCHIDVATHGEHRADDEADEAETVSPRGMEETPFAREINKMVTADAPERIAVVAEIGDRVDAMITAWCFTFPGRTEVISAGPGGVRGIFSTPEQALKLLSADGKAKLRLVSVIEAQKQAIVDEMLADLERAQRARDQALTERDELVTSMTQLRQELAEALTQAKTTQAEAERTRERLQTTADKLIAA